MRDKRRASSPFFGRDMQKVGEGAGFSKMEVFSERVCNFSLGFRLIEPSDFFGPRSKMVLCREDYAWAPVLGVFDKLCEVWGLPYLL